MWQKQDNMKNGVGSVITLELAFVDEGDMGFMLELLSWYSFILHVGEYILLLMISFLACKSGPPKSRVNKLQKK